MVTFLKLISGNGANSVLNMSQDPRPNWGRTHFLRRSRSRCVGRFTHTYDSGMMIDVLQLESATSWWRSR